MPRKYSTTLNTRPLLFKETKLIAALLLEGQNEEEIKEQVTENNLFQLASKDRAGRFYREILKRLEELDDYLLQQVTTADSQTSKLILLYAILKKDRLFYEWMKEVVYNKRLVFDFLIRKSETRRFIENKSEQEEAVRNWTENTKRRLINAYHQVLTDAEVASATGLEEMTLQAPLLNPAVRQYMIENKEPHIVEVLLGEPIA